MKDIDLTVGQINLICAIIKSENASRKAVISSIFEMLPDVKESEMISIAEQTVCMLEEMSDEEFEECHFPEIMEI